MTREIPHEHLLVNTNDVPQTPPMNVGASARTLASPHEHRRLRMSAGDAEWHLRSPQMTPTDLGIGGTQAMFPWPSSTDGGISP
ncbi:hypothetical protein [Acrocarpospora phusangensis]|nr:hypothetical protein [Acrocarpospora phusangensis]